MAVSTSPINTIEYRNKLADKLDRRFTQKSNIAFFTDNNFATQFVGTKGVLIDDVTFTGLGNYKRDVGHVLGSMKFNQELYELEMERGAKFLFDRMDLDEVGLSEKIGAYTKQFTDEHIVPETDSYAFSKLAAVANSAAQLVEGSKPFEILNNAIAAVEDVVGYDEELVAVCGSKFWRQLNSTDELQRHIDIGDFKKGEITTKVRKIDKTILLPVPQSNMMTQYEFLDGEVFDGTTEDKMGGYKVAEGAKEINCIVLPRKVAKFVKKLDKVRIFNPDENINVDSWQFDFRVYYDLFVKKTQQNAVWASIKG